MASPFDVLRIDADADDAEIERAYRQRVKETHPDQGGSAEAFQAVQAAYDAITSGNWTESGADESAEWDQHLQSESRVEYLNYEVLGDHGWALGDDDLFEKAAAADLDPVDHSRLVVQPEESLLEAAERRGFAWPYACRGGACANCAIAVVDGEITQPVDHILPSDLTERGIRLSCNGIPITPEMKVVYNIKQLPVLEDLRLPPYPFENAYSTG